MAQKAISVRFEPVRGYRKGDVLTYAVSQHLADSLESLGYNIDTYSAGPLSAQNDLEAITAKCGQLQKCVEVRDPRTNLTRPMNSVLQVVQGDIIGDCGFFLSQNASSCFTYPLEYFSYIPSVRKWSYQLITSDFSTTTTASSTAIIMMGEVGTLLDMCIRISLRFWSCDVIMNDGLSVRVWEH